MLWGERFLQRVLFLVFIFKVKVYFCAYRKGYYLQNIMLAASREVFGPLTSIANLLLTSQGAGLGISEKYILCCRRGREKKKTKKDHKAPSFPGSNPAICQPTTLTSFAILSCRAGCAVGFCTQLSSCKS